MPAIYLDNHSSTRCDPRVVDAMLPYLTEDYGNPSNGLNVFGRRAAEAVEVARDKLCALIDAQPGEVIFTSGATESNNLAIHGLSRWSAGRRKLVVSAVEHKSVLEAAKDLREAGFEVAYLPVDSQGTVLLDVAADLIDDATVLVSVQAANNEIGTIQPVAEIAAIAHDRGAVVHCDAAQAVGKIHLDVHDWGVDLLSISSHKLYGPKGVGALYVRGGASTKRLAPRFFGGDQEHGLRPGTLNVPGIVGLGEACWLCRKERDEDDRRVRQLRDDLEERLLSTIPGLRRNGNLSHRLSGNSSLTLPEVDADAMLLNLPEIALSTGSACTSGAPDPSHVLTAIGISRDLALSTIRVGVGRFNTAAEIQAAAGLLTAAYRRLTKESSYA